MDRKTTVYLPDDLKAELEREARRRGVSEAQVIREAIGSAVSRPRPRAAIISGPTFAAKVDKDLEGFGTA